MEEKGAGFVAIAGRLGWNRVQGNSISLGALGATNSGNTAFSVYENPGQTTTALTATINFSTGTATFPGIIENGTTNGGTTLAIVKAGGGTQILSGTSTYTGGTNVTGGILESVGTASVPSYNTSSLQVGNGATFAIGVGTSSQWTATSIGNLITGASFAAGSYVGFDTTNGAISYGNNITNSPNIGVNKFGTGVLTLGGNNSYTQGTLVSGGTLALGHSTALGNGPVALYAGAIDLAGNSTTIGALSGTAGSTITNSTGGAVTLTTNIASGSSNFAGVIQNGSGTTTLTLSGGGALGLSGVNTYTGGTNIGGGTVQLGNSSALGTGPVALYAGALDLNAQNLGIGALSGSAGSTITNTTGSWVTLTTNFDNGASTFAGIINDGAGTTTLTKSGGGVLVLNGVDTYSGGTNIGGGTLQLGNSSALGTGGLALSTGVLDLAGYSPTVGALSGTAGSTITNSSTGTVTLTTNIAAGTSTFSGVIANGGGTVSLTKSGGGVLVLSGSNTYSGGTTVNDGTLVVANTSGSATGTGNVTMNGGTLASAASGGSISGKVLAGSGTHTIAPGGVGKIGSMDVGGLTTASNLTVLDFDLATPGGSGDLLVIGSGGLTLLPHTAIVFGTDPTATGDYRLIGGSFGGTDALGFRSPGGAAGRALLALDDGRLGLYRPGGGRARAFFSCPAGYGRHWADVLGVAAA